ncbi:VirB8/TrbF family protein [Candidatus Tisiphia endosymbiont of Nemotelus uliginosus]|uniref:VirB8/TrbF family protein n=1 Tax=Candidatus Tisiphia endosymbiont of Nemotelus uliginosus TaxID=3077926 RepID=UPI0035C914FD
MDKLLSSLQDYIKSGQYFLDSREWYNTNYIYPLVQRSVLFLFFSITLILFIVVAVSVNNLLPITRQVRYAVNSATFNNATITSAQDIKNDSLSSIADIMIRNYLLHRESYDYDLLHPQFNFIQNNSTRIVFLQFVNFMNIDNQLSPVMRYQRNFRRSIKIGLITYHKNNRAEVEFTSTVKNISNEILENMEWKAIIHFEIDPINIHLPPNSKFNFVVTSYKLKLIEDKSNR